MSELAAGTKVAVPYLERQLAGPDGSTDGGASDDYSHDGWIAHLTVETIAVVTADGVTVTVTLEHSDDGESWDEIDHADFTAGTGSASFTIDAPKAHTRVSWTIDDPDYFATVEAEGIAEAITPGELGSKLADLDARVTALEAP